MTLDSAKGENILPHQNQKSPKFHHTSQTATYLQPAEVAELDNSATSLQVLQEDNITRNRTLYSHVLAYPYHLGQAATTGGKIACLFL